MYNINNTKSVDSRIELCAAPKEVAIGTLVTLDPATINGELDNGVKFVVTVDFYIDPEDEYYDVVSGSISVEAENGESLSWEQVKTAEHKYVSASWDN